MASGGYAFKDAAGIAMEDRHRRSVLTKITIKSDKARAARLSADFHQNTDAIRSLGAAIKDRALADLPGHLESFIDRFEQRGGVVHYAADAAEARSIIRDLCQQAVQLRAADAPAGPCRVVKAKSMATEEIHLNHALEAAGVHVTETDLGEYVVQVGGRRPTHIVTPIIDMSRGDVSDIFADRLGQPRTDDPATLTMQARSLLREAFQRADVGISGGNFLVAQTGTLVLCTNEGNCDLSISAPRMHIALVGVEKVVATWAEAAVLLKLLARSGTAQPITVYTSLIHGPRQPGEHDGPEQLHLVLLDAGRSRVLSQEAYVEALRCLRCGACLNACPVFRQIGGQPYGGIYSGPIGKVLTPLLEGEQTYCDLPNASSLCGACLEACPVRIDIPRMLLDLRADQVRRRERPLAERTAFATWVRAIGSRRLYEAGQRLFRWGVRSAADPNGYLQSLPIAPGWTGVRDLPVPAEKSFRELWRQSNGAFFAPIPPADTKPPRES